MYTRYYCSNINGQNNPPCRRPVATIKSLSSIPSTSPAFKWISSLTHVRVSRERAITYPPSLSLFSSLLCVCLPNCFLDSWRIRFICARAVYVPILQMWIRLSSISMQSSTSSDIRHLLNCNRSFWQINKLHCVRKDSLHQMYCFVSASLSLSFCLCCTQV